MRRIVLLGWITLVTLLLLQSAGFSQQPLTVLRGATAIDVVAGTSIPDAVVVIDGDRIRSFGGKDTSYPPNAETVDLKGKFVIPGLVDAHTHYTPWTGELFLNYGVTTAIISGGRGGFDDAYWNGAQTGGVRTPRLFAGARRRLAVTDSMTREQVRAAVRDYVEDGATIYGYAGAAYPAANIVNPQRRQVFQWTAEAFHEAGLFVWGHTDDVPASVKAGLDGIEHPWGYAESLMSPEELVEYQHGKLLNYGTFLKPGPRIDELIRDSVQRDVYLNPTLVYEYAGSSPLAPQFERLVSDLYRNPALMTYYPQNLAQGLVQRFNMVKNFSSRYPPYVSRSQASPADLRVFDESYRGENGFVKRWVALGGKIMGGTDDPTVGTSGLSVHMEMAMLVEAGLTPLQALRSFTIWAAEPLTVRKKIPTKPVLGVLREGAFADIVVLDADPLKNIDNTRKISRVMKGGQFLKLGYTPDYTAPGGRSEAVSATAHPEISAVAPSTFKEGHPNYKILVEGVGFFKESVVRVEGEEVPTEFVDLGTLRATIPGSTVARAVSNRPGQLPGDRTLKVTVFNHPPDGGVSNPVSLRSDVSGGSSSNVVRPEISAITPSRVTEGNPEFTMVVDGVGFTKDSVVRLEGANVPTQFGDMHTLRATIPASTVAQATPDRLSPPGLGMLPGVYGDRTVKVTVSNNPSDREISNVVSLRIKAKWKD